VTRGWLPQTAGSPSLNGGGAAAAVPPDYYGIIFNYIINSQSLYHKDYFADYSIHNQCCHLATLIMSAAFSTNQID